MVKLRRLHDFRQFPISTLLLSALYAVIALSLLFALSIAAELRAGKSLDAAMSFSSAIMESTVGISVALAGSLATLYLAVLGLRMVEAQALREEARNAREFISKANSPCLATLGACLAYLTAAEKLYVDIKQNREDLLEKQKFDDYEDQFKELDPLWRESLSKQAPDVIRYLEEFKGSVRELSKSTEAVALWRAADSHSRYNQLANLTHPSWNENFSVSLTPVLLLSPLENMSSILNSYTQNENSRFGMLIKYTSFLNFYKKDKRASDAIQNGWNFLFTSFLLYSQFVDDESNESLFLNLGGAFLLDFIDAIPTVEETLAYLKANFFLDREIPKFLVDYVTACSPSASIPPYLSALLAHDPIDLLSFK